jgi:hypothetical protein
MSMQATTDRFHNWAIVTGMLPLRGLVKQGRLVVTVTYPTQTADHFAVALHSRARV